MVPIRGVAILLLLGVPGLAAPENGYVDSKICWTCHREIAANYATTGMARSFFKPATSNTVEDYRKTPEYYRALSDSHYAMTIRDGQYFQRRWQPGGDKDGAAVHLREAAKGNDGAVAKQAEQALRELGIR